VHPGCAQGQGQVKGHVIRTLSWILGMSYSVIDGLVIIVFEAVYVSVSVSAKCL